ncbi:MAG TPA: lysylphosphatidylglycerol synthase transmembrane domain-containing protein [Pseudolabrys sp.]|nr:lysylphosphatidylglycerol synthase transmembrane domain-containing protein [Pseudolabrys sp.]
MRRLFALAIKAAVSAGLLYLALDFVNLATLRGRLGDIKPLWIAAGLLVILIQLALTSLRWQRIALTSGAPLTAPRALLYMLIGMFFNQTLPSTVGGDAARVWLLARHNSGLKPALYSVLIDRGVGLLWLALIVLACLPWSLTFISNPVGRIALIAIGSASIAGVIGLFAIDRIARLLMRWRLTRHLAEAASLAWTVLVSPKVGLSIAALSIVGHGLTVLTAWCAARAVGSPLELVQALLLILPVVLIASVPISIAGWGVREGVMVAAFAYAGLPQSDGLLVSLIFGAESFAIGVIGGLAWIASGERIKPETAPA